MLNDVEVKRNSEKCPASSLPYVYVEDAVLRDKIRAQIPLIYLHQIVRLVPTNQFFSSSMELEIQR